MSEIEDSLRRKGFVPDGNGGYMPGPKPPQIVEATKSRRPTLDASAIEALYETKMKIMVDTNSIRMNIKPMSVNEAFTGKRYKTPEYRAYCKQIKKYLPPLELPKPPYKIYFKFGFSSSLSDFDNPVKVTLDPIAKFYKFNDKLVKRGVIDVVTVEKGNEYFEFKIESL